MKNLLYLSLLFGLCFVVACSDDDDDDTHEETTTYSITIMSPDTAAKHVGDTVHLHVNFDEADGGTIHHVNVRIYERDSGEEIYTAPTEAHVHTDAHYEHHDDVVLDVTGHSNWVLEAKVWGHEDGEHEVTMTREFHVHPKEGHEETHETEYSVMIMSPDTTAKHVGDTIHLHVNFDEAHGNIIHHINVQIYEKSSGTVIYSAPAEAHAHVEAHHEHHDDVILDVAGHTDWVLEAKAWGHDGGEHEVVEMVEFHVHP